MLLWMSVLTALLSEVCSILDSQTLSLLSNVFSEQQTTPAPSVVFASSDIRIKVRDTGCSPRFQQWSFTHPGEDIASRPLRCFGFAPVRRIRASFTVEVYRSNLGSAEISEDSGVRTVSKPKARYVERCSSMTQTPLGAFQSPTTGFYVYKWPTSGSNSYNSKQLQRQKLRADQYFALRTLKKTIIDQSCLMCDVPIIYTMPIYTNPSNAKQSKCLLDLVFFSLLT